MADSGNIAFPNGRGMDPSAWRQVRENMERIAGIIKLLNEMDMWNILDENEHPDFASLLREMLKILADLVDRIGTLTALVNNIDVNNPPGDYKYDITYEFKDPKKIGLGDKKGFKGDEKNPDLTHCLLQTVITASIEGDTNFRPYQLAIGRDMCQYYRYQTESSTGTKIWGKWKKIQYGTLWLVRDAIPEDDEQEPGDFLLLKK